jgi:hypothetical protein
LQRFRRITTDVKQERGDHMRKLLIGLLVLASVCAGLIAAHGAANAAATKTAICHRTASAANPYVKLRVSTAVLRGHLRHAADMIPAPAGSCPSVVLSPSAGGQVLATTLTGSAGVPGPGDPDGAGTAAIRLRAGEGRICSQLNVSKITLPASAAHIHVGAAGQAGAVVVPLTAPNADGIASGCVGVARTLVTAILANSHGYYVNVHTSDFPDGAVRGQL